MNRDFIKMLAILAMTLNHIGNILMEPGSMLQVIFVDIGYFTALGQSVEVKISSPKMLLILCTPAKGTASSLHIEKLLFQ